MLRIIIFVLAIIPSLLMAQTGSKTALLLIDIQDFYFPGGMSALVEPEAAAEQAALLLDDFRAKNQLVIHVRHDFEPGGNIHQLVRPLPDEKVITKKEVNSFKDTDLLSYLQEHQVDTLVIAGMQTHMCLEGGVRAAHDYGFVCYVVQDACATKELIFDGETIAAKDVHLSTLNTLKSYAKVLDTKTYLENKK